MKKKKVSIYLTDTMHAELKKQANALGLDMGSYVVLLLVEKKNKKWC